MKGKKYKRSSHQVLNVYGPHFSFHAPYQVIVDSAFCIESLKSKMIPKESMPVVFGNSVKPMITKCSLHELEVLSRNGSDELASGAVFVARRLEQRNCRHDSPRSSKECIMDVIAPDNKHHYAVAANEDQLRYALRSIPGVPLLFIKKGILLMEPLSEATKREVAAKERQKFVVPEHEKKALQKLLPRPDQAMQDSKKTKRRKAKNPNPLSVQKAKKKVEEPKTSAPHASKKRKRVRPRRKKRVVDAQ